MRISTIKNGRWLRKATAAGLVSLLPAKVLIVLLCVPETLNAGTEIRREMTVEELHDFLSGEERFTILLSEGGAIRGNGITVLADSIHLGHITRATDGKRHPKGSETAIAIGSVKEIRVEAMRGSLRLAGAVGFGLLGFFLPMVAYSNQGIHIIDTSRRGEVCSVLLSGAVGGAVLGYWLGKRKDHETIIITIVN